MMRSVAIAAIVLLLATETAAQKRASAQPWFGMGVRPQRNQAASERRLLVERTVPNGPADRAGIRAGDIITRIAGAPIRFTDTLDLLLYLGDRKPGERLRFTIVRNGTAKDVVLTVAPMPDHAKAGWDRALQIARQERIAAHRSGQ